MKILKSTYNKRRENYNGKLKNVCLGEKAEIMKEQKNKKDVQYLGNRKCQV